MLFLRRSNNFRHFDAGLDPAIRLQRALDAPTKFGEHNVYLLRLPVGNVVLDLQHERLDGGEFGRIQLQFRQLFQDGPDLRLPLFLRSV